MSLPTECTSLFLVPRPSTAWRGNEAGWITSSGWASAGEGVWGEALVATPDGIFKPEESRLFPRGQQTRPGSSAIWKNLRKAIPEFLITAYKDLKLWKARPAHWPIEAAIVKNPRKVTLVWERHDLFAGPGRRLADQFKVPLVLSVEAAVVWEAARWGVKRPGWGWLLEKYSEGASLRKADLVVCVSDEVRHEVIRLGVLPRKAIVSQNRVDSTLFHPGVSGEQVKKHFGLDGKKVIGWTGSFRSFHGLETLIQAFHLVQDRHPDAVLLLVGDGQEFAKMNELVGRLGIRESVVFTGRKPFTEIPAFVASFDVALVTAASAQGFHYSPLKLREYLALGRAMVAPRAGDLPSLFVDEADLLLYEPGDQIQLASQITRLLTDAALRARLETRAKESFQREGTWIHELKRVCDVLGIPTDQPIAS